MRSRIPRPAVALGVALAVVLALVAGVAWWLGRPDSRLAAAVEMAPADTQRVSWVDWAGVRRELGASLDEGSSAEEVRDLLDEAFDRDLSATSALGESAAEMHLALGFSPATVDWELFTQGTDGAALVLGAGDLDLDEVADSLEELGYTRPEDEDGVWTGGPDVLARSGATLTPELSYLALDRDRHLLVASDAAAYVEVALAAARDDGPRVEGLDEVVAASGDALAAAVYTGSYACEELAMARADPAAQAEAEALVAQAGGVHPLTAFAMGVRPGGDVRVAMGVADAEDARADADARAALAAGPAPGQGGDFGDRFTVESAGAEGSVVLLDLRPAARQYVLSDLSTGPVLFATC